MSLQKYPVVLPLLSLLLSTGCGNKESSTRGSMGSAVDVQVETVGKQQVIYYDDYPAILSALNQVELRPQVSGYITGIFFKDGAQVRQGQKLYSIDPQQYEANYQQAQANLQVQQTNLVKAQKDAARYHQLDQEDAISKQQVDYANAALEAAQKQVDAAKAAVRAAETSVRYTNIYAPFSGTIGISLVKIGSPATAGQTLLNTISADNPIAADISVDQSEIYRFTRLEKQQKSGDSTFRLILGTEWYPLPGNIRLIDRAVDPQTSTIRMRIVFPNRQDLLKPGMSGTVKVMNSGTAPVVVIPFKAVTEQLGEYFAYVVHDSTVNQRKLVLGKQLGTTVVVKNGLSEGEEIVTEGVQNLREGATIRINSPAANPK